MSSSSSSSSSSGASGYSITLRRLVSNTEDTNVTWSYRMRVNVISATGLNPEVFVWQRRYSGDDEFQTVAKPTDLEELVNDAPDPTVGNTTPLFLLDYVDLLFNTMTDLTSAWDEIVRQVTKLLTSLEALDNIEEESTITLTPS